MSEDKIKRRRFLADVLFAGGGLTAAAFLAKAGFERSQPDQLPGAVAVPNDGQTPTCEQTPSCTPTPDDPSLGGEPMPPEPPMPGQMALPQPPPEVIPDGDVAAPRECK